MGGFKEFKDSKTFIGIAPNTRKEKHRKHIALNKFMFNIKKMNISHTMKYIELNGLKNLCFYYILTLACKR